MYTNGRRFHSCSESSGIINAYETKILQVSRINEKPPFSTQVKCWSGLSFIGILLKSQWSLVNTHTTTQSMKTQSGLQLSWAALIHSLKKDESAQWERTGQIQQSVTELEIRDCFWGETGQVGRNINFFSIHRCNHLYYPKSRDEEKNWNSNCLLFCLLSSEPRTLHTISFIIYCCGVDHPSSAYQQPYAIFQVKPVPSEGLCSETAWNWEQQTI